MGNVYLGGFLYNTVTHDREIALIKYDKNGIYQWDRIWNTNDDDYCWDIAIDSSDNIYLGGSTLYGGFGSDHSVLLIKYDQMGVQEWNRTWHDQLEECHAITIDSSDNIVLTGQIHIYDPKQYDILLLVYNSTGDVQWQNRWGGNENDVGYGIVLDSSDNIYVTGMTNTSEENGYDICLIKFNSSG